MSKIADGSLHDWKDGEVVTADKYKQERELLRQATNDNDTQRANHEALKVDPTSSDTTQDKHVSNKNLKDLHDKDAELAGTGRTTETIKGNADALTTHKSSADHDGRYYTQTEADNLLLNKADKSDTYTKQEVDDKDSNLQSQISSNDNDIVDLSDRINAANNGTMQGFYESDTFPTDVSNGTIVLLTADYYWSVDGNTYKKDNAYKYNANTNKWEFFAGRSDNVKEQTIQHGLSIIVSDRKTPLFMKKLIGKTVINHVPLFDSGLWSVHSNATVDSPTKLTLNAINNNENTVITTSGVKPSTNYFIANKGNGTIHIRFNHSDGSTTWEYSTENKTFTTPSSFDVMQVYLTNATRGSGTYTFEDIMLNVGTTKQEFTSNVRGVKNPVLFSYGKNLFNIYDVDLHANAELTDSKTITHANNSGSNEDNTIEMSVVSGKTYTFSFSKTNGDVYWQKLDSDGNIVLSSSSATSPVNITMDSNVTSLKAIFRSSVNGETATFSDIQLELGSTATSFEPYNASYQVIKGTFYDNDQLTWNEHNEPVKLADKKGIALDGSLDWEFNNDHSGFKQVIALLPSKPKGELSNPFADLSKYDGSILQAMNSEWEVDEFLVRGDFNDKVYVTISDEDSGWTEAWQGADGAFGTSHGLNRDATAREMIQAYFNGWHFDYDPNGDGTVSDSHWESLYNSSVTSTNVDEVISRNLHEENGKEGYRLIYELSDKETEVLEYEGKPQLHEGDNQVEVTEGLVVREVANPEYNSNFDRYDINSGSSHVTDNQLLNYSYISNVLSVYKNGKVDGNWSKQGNKYGYELLCDAENFDPQATYTVTYFALPYQLTSEVNQVDVEYAQDLNSTVDQLVEQTTDNERKITVLDKQKANKHQEGWIEPILMNGWQVDGYSVGYMKDDLGTVHVRGRVKGGSLDTVVFILPTSYRPESFYGFSTRMGGGTGTVSIGPDGSLTIREGATSYAYINVSFRAKQ